VQAEQINQQLAIPCALGTPPLLRMGPLARRSPRRRGREPSFGMGVLEVKSATEAEWVWHRNQDPFLEEGDRVTFRRGDPACVGRRAPPPALA